MEKPEDRGELSEHSPVRSRKDIKDLIWVLNQTPEDYKRFGKEEFETHPIWPLEGFRWEDQLNLYRREMLNMTPTISITMPYGLTRHIILDKLNIINECWKKTGEPLLDFWDYEKTLYLDAKGRGEVVDRLYLRCCQARDATNPILNGDDAVRKEIHYQANFLVYFLASIQSGFAYRYPNRKEVELLNSQLIKNTPAHTPYRKKKVGGAYKALDRVLKLDKYWSR